MRNKQVFVQRDNSWTPVCELVDGKKYTVGRSRKNDVVVEDDHCSRTHLEILSRDDAWLVRDLNTHNGTIVRGQPLTSEQFLENGDTIEIGLVTLLFADKDDLQQGTVTSLLDHLKHDTGVARARAQQDIVAYYYQRLCKLARSKGAGLDYRAEDEEDAVISACASFFHAVDGDRLDKLDDRNDLWRILATFTARKVHRQRERQTAQKRAVNRTVTDSALRGPGDVASSQLPGIQGLPDDDLDHVLMVGLNDSLEALLALLDEELREVAVRRIKGYTYAEIGEAIQCAERTIERRMKDIREIWEKSEFGQDLL